MADERKNPPKQPALRYRFGSQPDLLARMISRISRQSVPPDSTAFGLPRPLRVLTSRDPADNSIALMDVWACALDVVSFYQERIINEGYLGTATERRSLVEIGRAIGYVPRPGSAAATQLVFTVDTAPTSPSTVNIPIGLAVLAKPEPSTPAALPPAREAPPGPPPTFETVEAIDAFREYNVLYPVRTVKQAFSRDTDYVHVDPNARLSIGDPVLLIDRSIIHELRDDERGGSDQLGEEWDLRFVAGTEIIPGPPGSPPESMRVALDRTIGDPFTAPSDDPVVFTFRERASIFGHAAPPFRAMPDLVRERYGAPAGSTAERWPDYRLVDDPYIEEGILHLDREYSKIIAHSYVCLQSREEVEVYRAARVSPSERDDFGITAKCTRIDLAPLRPSSPQAPEHLRSFSRRSTVVHAVSERIERREEPFTDALEGTEIELSALVPAMAAGRRVIVSGTTVAGESLIVATRVAAFGTTTDGLRSVLTIEYLLPPMVRDSVAIYGNVALATHGSTVPPEVLGSGRNDLGGQRFTLKNRPLTWIAAATPSGVDSTLEIRVNDVLWTRVDTLYGQAPDAQVYELRSEEDGTTIVQFGDGVQGARLPTGQENVTAKYRRDLGLGGEVGANRLSILQQRPIGLRGVDNLEAATGAADPESFDSIRTSAPLIALTLDRLVSLLDYESFGRAFTGFAKARADALWDGRRDLVHLTVGSASGVELQTDDEVFVKLREAIRDLRDPRHTVIVSPLELLRFAPRVDILRDESYRAEDVEAAVHAALAAKFGYAAQQIGEPVTEAGVLQAMHGVAGVVAANVTGFFVDVWGIPVLRTSNILDALPARRIGTTNHPAQLLVLEPTWSEIGWMGGTT